MEAHESFRQYAKDYPVVAHNLAYDWNCALVPEWARLGLPTIGRRGFCTVTLSRRVLPESVSHGLDALRVLFGLCDGPSHKALADVGTVVRLFRELFSPRLKSAGLMTYEAWEKFSRRTPISECWRTINPGMRLKTRRDVADAWEKACALWWDVNNNERYWHAWCKRVDWQMALMRIDPAHWSGDLDHLLPLVLANLPAELCEREKAARTKSTVPPAPTSPAP